jgi:hypothetical protein
MIYYTANATELFKDRERKKENTREKTTYIVKTLVFVSLGKFDQ